MLRGSFAGLAIFTLSSSTLHAATEAFFTEPYTNNTAARDKVISVINSATSTLDIAIYTFTYARSGNTLSQIAGALQAARNRGVTLRLVTDVNEASTITDSQFIILDNLDGNRNNILDNTIIRSGNPYAIMHDKFIIADNARVLTGSTNWTQSAFLDQENNVIVLEGASIAAAYKAEFDQMWGGTYGNNNQPKAQHNYTTTEGIPIELWFGADDDLTGRMISAINSATSRIYFCINTFSTGTKADQIATAFKSALARGVDVRGVMDNDVDQWPYLVSSPNPIPMGDYIPSSGGLLHSKFMIIDPGLPTATTLTGSNNWSNAADLDNDENLVILNSVPFTNQYFDNFRTMYVNKSDNGGGTTVVRKFGDLDGDFAITVADFNIAKAISNGQVAPTGFQLITGDVAPTVGINGHSFGDGIIDIQDVTWLANYLGIPVNAGTDTISDCLSRVNGAAVATEPLLVTTVIGSVFYAQQLNRACAIRVSGTAAVGDKVWITGTMAQLNSPYGERYINATQIDRQSQNNAVPSPLRLPGILLGGEAKNPTTPGIYGAVGLYNIGQRVTLTGKVYSYGSLSFYVDDGSGIIDLSGNQGVKISSGSLTRPAIGSTVSVTGISAMEVSSGKAYRVIRVAAQSDIVTLAP